MATYFKYIYLFRLFAHLDVKFESQPLRGGLR